MSCAKEGQGIGHNDTHTYYTHTAWMEGRKGQEETHHSMLLLHTGFPALEPILY